MDSRTVILAAGGLAAVAAAMFLWRAIGRMSDNEEVPPAKASVREGTVNGEGSAAAKGPARKYPPGEYSAGEGPAEAEAASRPGDDEFLAARRRMVEEQLAARDIHDPRVLDAMLRVPRHRFVPEALAAEAYDDHPLSIGHGQTISQPYIVALMTQLAAPQPESRALDVGTGSGYQAAVLAELCREVHSIEILEPLAAEAAERLKRLGYRNVTVRTGDGYRGWPEKAPFDLIIVAAAPDHVPQPLIDQLAPGGRLVIPVGDARQELLLIEKGRDGTVRRESVAPVMFVPMTGEAMRKGSERRIGR
ncbi:MAG: protein-L-isoaspartate(D-aspartate) O-methyltransferase [Thermogutta sp.]